MPEIRALGRRKQLAEVSISTATFRAASVAFI
jgi:hypothetical protein